MKYVDPHVLRYLIAFCDAKQLLFSMNVVSKIKIL